MSFMLSSFAMQRDGRGKNRFQIPKTSPERKNKDRKKFPIKTTSLATQKDG